MWCALVWALVGLGVVEDYGTHDPAYFHTQLPYVIRVGGWWVTAALGAYGAFTNHHPRLAVSALMVMPLQRLTSYLWAWVMSLIPGAPPGVASAWYPAIYYLLMVGLVLIAAHIREPAARTGPTEQVGGGAWTGQ